VFDSDSSSDDDADGGGGKVPVNAALSFGAESEFTSAASGAKGYVNDTGLGVLWGAPGASVASSSSSRKKSEATAPSGLTHKQRYLADMRQRAQVRPRRRFSMSYPSSHTSNRLCLACVAGPAEAVGSVGRDHRFLRILHQGASAFISPADSSTSSTSCLILHQAEDGYARDFSELTLQQILRRLARLLERKARANAAKLAAKKDVTLLHPPPDHDPTFYPDKLKKFPQYRDYFYKKEAKEDARILTHMHKGTANIDCACLRSTAAVIIMCVVCCPLLCHQGPFAASTNWTRPAAAATPTSPSSTCPRRTPAPACMPRSISRLEQHRYICFTSSLCTV